MGLPSQSTQWDHSSYEQFYQHYAETSQTQETTHRFVSLRDMLLRIVKRKKHGASILNVADIGCGAGAQAIVWAELGHEVHGLDVNEPLITLARQRAAKTGFKLEFQIGSALELPWADQSMDICLAIELLEHVKEWKICLSELIRILRPGGVLCLTTTNKLCPFQQEYKLPLYSWYPTAVKQYFERLAVTTRPELAYYAKYPAINWFTFYSLRTKLTALGFQVMDRFDVIETSNKSTIQKMVLYYVHKAPMLRWIAHVATSGTLVVAIKPNSI
jgi:2-polyprenyl-6-hydroxyphenyl methylase/3-demethylubiquinone-9 3-methyltransferase